MRCYNLTCCCMKVKSISEYQNRKDCGLCKGINFKMDLREISF